jgi:hypothetical protein
VAINKNTPQQPPPLTSTPSPAAAYHPEAPPFDLTHPPDPINDPPHRRRFLSIATAAV